MKRKTKDTFASLIIVISTIFIVFNNVGQSITLVDIPFSRTFQFWVGLFSLFAGIIWTLDLRRIF